MSRIKLLVVLQLCFETISILTLSSVHTANAVSTASVATLSIGTSTSALPNSGKTSSKSPATSTTTSSGNATSSKPTKDKTIISSIPTFDFSLPDKQPKPEIVDTCHNKDMCKTLTGVCIKGTCHTKKCSMEIYCTCDPGFTGQFCDKNITTIELKNGKGKNGHHEATSTISPSNKELVSGKSVTTPKSNGLVNGKSNTTSVNKELLNDKLTTAPKNKDLTKLTTAPKNKDLANSTSTITPKTKVLVNGYIDFNLIKTKSGNIHSGNDNKNKHVNVNGKNRNDDGKVKDGQGGSNNEVNRNGKMKNNKVNEIMSLDKKKSSGDSEKVSRKVTNDNKQITRSVSKNGSSGNQNVNQNKKMKSKSRVKSGHSTAAGSKNIKDIFSGKTVNAEKVSKIFSDGSYLKGPEVHVPSDHSVIDMKTSRNKIDKGKPSLIDEQGDIVTITATSVEQTQLGVAPELLSPVFREPLETSKKKTLSAGTKSAKQAESVVMKTDSKNSKTNEKVSKGITEIKSLEKPKSDIVSAVDVAKTTPILVATEAGSVGIPNNTVIEVSPVFANSEIKITIETSNVGKLLNGDNSTDKPVGLKINEVTASKADRSKKIVNQNAKGVLDGVENVLKQEKNGIKSKPARKDSTKLQLPSVKKSNTAALALKGTTSTNKSTQKMAGGAGQNSDIKAGARQTLHTRTSTTSEMMNPIMELMNIFRSHKFVENVSAVKIEIITKQNSTDVQKPSKERIKQNSKTLGTKGGTT